ncbi:MAG: hypothetical protein N3D11_16630, partial [Candidatus Sumerlaeia bacterium]|nr:hypothetical protein [Candidatus Sumerlaeia bacterium]
DVYAIDQHTKFGRSMVGVEADPPRCRNPVEAEFDLRIRELCDAIEERSRSQHTRCSLGC